VFSPRDLCPWFFGLCYWSRVVLLSFLWHHLRGLVLSDSDTLSPSAPIANKASAYALSALPMHMRPTHKGSSPAGTACSHICRAHTRGSSGELRLHAVLTSVTTVTSWSRGDRGLFGGADLGDLVPGSTIVTSSHPAALVSWSAFCRPSLSFLSCSTRETTTSTPPVLISSCIWCSSRSGGWPAVATRLPMKRRHACVQGVRELVPS
jgi:hypothetical protein